MALFTDGPVSGMEDLTAQDTQLPTVAAVEGIDVTQKLRLAQEELSLELEAMLDGSRGSEQLFWQAARANIDGVVVTPALKLWHTYRALELVYEDAYSSQLNDRYAAKRVQFQERVKWAYEKLLQTGIGIVRSPLRQAATPRVTGAPGNLPDGTYYVAVSWTNADGEEGAASVPATLATTASTLVVQTANPPEGAAGWNAYVGAAPEDLWQQNESPIAIGQTWLQPDALKAQGRAPGCGQSASYLKPVPRRLMRG